MNQTNSEAQKNRSFAIVRNESSILGCVLHYKQETYPHFYPYYFVLPVGFFV